MSISLLRALSIGAHVLAHMVPVLLRANSAPASAKVAISAVGEVRAKRHGDRPTHPALLGVRYSTEIASATMDVRAVRPMRAPLLSGKNGPSKALASALPFIR